MGPLLVFYIITGTVMVLAAVAMVAARNMVYSVLYMVLVFLATAVLYILYQAPLIAMLQITVYAGGIMVLFLFVIMLIGPAQMSHTESLLWQRPLAFTLAAILSAELLLVAFRQSPLVAALDVGTDFGAPDAVGLMIFKDYVLPFEIVSVLLLVAMVGAIVLTMGKGRER